MPGLATVVILSLGVGIGVNTTVFSWIQAVVLRPLPGVPDGSSFYLIEPRTDTGSYPGVSWREYQDLRERVGAFRDTIGYRMAPVSVGDAARTERAFAMLVSGNYFQALGLTPALGRFIAEGEARRPGGDPVVVVSHDYWQTHLGGRATAAGERLRVNEQDLTIVGIAPEGFQGTTLGLQFDLWIPATMAPVLMAGSRELDDRSLRGYSVMGRLKPQATEARARTEVDAAMRDLARVYPESNGAMQSEILKFWKAPRGPQRMIASGLGILQALMLLVLLVVCGNTANLMLARASTRLREVGVRLSLGASPATVVRLLLVENVTLGLMGAALGIVIAVWGTTALRAMPPYGALPIRFQTSVDALGLAFALALGVGCGLLFGLGPAVQMARIDPQQALRNGSRTGGRSPMRDALMGLQVALALLVLVAGGLFFKSFAETRLSDTGFRTDGVLLATYDLTGRSSDDDFPRAFAARLLDRLRSVPAIEAAAISSSVPLDIHGLPGRAFTLEGRATTSAAPDIAVSNVVTPGYFATLGIPLLSGSDFVDLNDTALATRQVIVNQAFVARYIGAGEVLGRRLENRNRDYVITGVVRDSTYDAFGEPPTPAVFFSYREKPSTIGEIHIRSRAGTEAVMIAEVQRAVHDLDPTLPVYNIRTMTEHIDKNLILRRIPARLFVVVAPLLLGLVAIGIYAVVAYAVAHRTAEIGVRVALGASGSRVVRQIMWETMVVVGFGAACGWALAVMIDLHLFRGGLEDAPVLVGVPALLLAVAVTSCWMPARRATLVDPLVALRSE